MTKATTLADIKKALAASKEERAKRALEKEAGRTSFTMVLKDVYPDEAVSEKTKKKYKRVVVEYRVLPSGKLQEKKIPQFSPELEVVLDALDENAIGKAYVVSLEKEDGYWRWKSLELTEAVEE